MNRLKELRKEKGLTFKKLAQDTGISSKQLSRYEKEEQEPKRETWEKLADYFGVSVAYLLGYQVGLNSFVMNSLTDFEFSLTLVPMTIEDLKKHFPSRSFDFTDEERKKVIERYEKSLDNENFNSEFAERQRFSDEVYIKYSSFTFNNDELINLFTEMRKYFITNRQVDLEDSTENTKNRLENEMFSKTLKGLFLVHDEDIAEIIDFINYKKSKYKD
ncbi:Helix-turn-helix domain-containing protein [Pilibacter termitis]|uniref:Helix-turn-helix domain-containing protein n=1 Tax=Pilibacter termitis TaxID=263852 RepID=A0A1T4L3Z1_9ENTE|nr:helix-turn-helix transcriptional regulator [Pilibacter termitis]SJZ49436.1 Helix-turn-helix domain-containing protein [Pilibacter termitis]